MTNQARTIFRFDLMRRKTNLTPNQIELARVPLSAILEKASSLPSLAPVRSEKDMLPVIKVLHEKGMFWTEIEQWMRDNTEFYRAAGFWKRMFVEAEEEQETECKQSS